MNAPHVAPFKQTSSHKITGIEPNPFPVSFHFPLLLSLPSLYVLPPLCPFIFPGSRS